MDIVYHYPPELTNLLIEAIPLLGRSYEDILLFLRSAGVEMSITADLWEAVRRDRKSTNKYRITRTVLMRLNEAGERALAERREVLKRVTEFEDFSACWPDDQLKAKGLVAEIRRVVNVKDSFTRINSERERERKQRVATKEAELRRANQRADAIARLKDSFFAMFSRDDAQGRGKALEKLLNELFQVYGILIREAFTLKGDAGEGIVEQIDGVIELDSHLYFVEMKWWQEAVGRSEVADHLVRVYHRPEARALFISGSGFSAPAIATCKESLNHGKVVTLCTLQELVMLLDRGNDLKEFLREKVTKTMVEKNPFPTVSAT